MRLHILGICGTFMGGLAKIARESGHSVSGCDAQVYPPMSDQLRDLDIDLHEGYDAAQLDRHPADLYVVGNAMKRGMPVVEAMLDRDLPYVSGPQWLAESALRGRWVLAVAGTHGKTTTASLLAWILEDAGLNPGFLVGGVPGNFGVSARLTDSPFFVIEADEYDTAFFDKRSKFVWYRPRTLVLNNLEYDHADIFPDLPAIETQFHHLVRTVPASGRIVANGAESSLERVLERGCWTSVERFGPGGAWEAAGAAADDSFEVMVEKVAQGRVRWELSGAHNRNNALAALAAARHAGVPPAAAIDALSRFKGVRRRMEVRGRARSVTVYDDFAHHPTAFAATLAGLRSRVGDARIVAVFEPRSNTMRLGAMQARLAASLAEADLVYCYASGLGWDPAAALASLAPRAGIFASIDELLDALVPALRPGDHVLVMSNGAFGAIHDRLLARLGDAPARGQ